MSKKRMMINLIMTLIMITSSIIQYNASSQNMIEKQKNIIKNTEQEMEWIIENSVQQLEIAQFLLIKKLESSSNGAPVKTLMYDNAYYVPESEMTVVSSLTGLSSDGQFSDALMKEIKDAISTNEVFEQIYSNIPDIKWIYYTSANRFLNIYPYINIEEYHVTEETFNYDFYTIVTPENNPEKKQQWTQLYQDQVTGDWMITISLPIYADGVFRGVLSIDYTFDTLSNILYNHTPGLENYLIFNQYDDIIAKHFETVDADINFDFDHLKGLDGNDLTDVGYYLVKATKLGRQPLYMATFIDKSLLYFNVLKQLIPILIFIFSSLIIVNLYYKSINVNSLLSASEKQFKTLFNQSPQFIIILNPQGVLIDANKFALNFMGLSREKAVGMSYSELPIWFDDEVREQHLDHYREIFKLKGEYRSEIKVKDAKSNIKELIYHLVSLKDNDGYVNRLVIIGTDVTDQKNLQDRLEDMSRTDILTQSYNRRGILDILEKSVENYENHQIKFAIVIGDIDYFKAVNDNYGHECGDEILQGIVRVMKNTVRQNDVIGRWGGEEFIIILSDVTHDSAYEIVDRIRKNIATTPFRCTNLEDPIYINMTIGFSMYNLKEPFKENIAKADIALYHGKRNGRNQTVSYQNMQKDL